MADQWDFWKRREAIRSKFDPLLVEHHGDAEKCFAVEEQMHKEMADVQPDEEILEPNRLLWRAHKLDVDLPQVMTKMHGRTRDLPTSPLC